MFFSECNSCDPTEAPLSVAIADHTKLNYVDTETFNIKLGPLNLNSVGLEGSIGVEAQSQIKSRCTSLLDLMMTGLEMVLHFLAYSTFKGF
jgi:hypothetical protein